MCGIAGIWFNRAVSGPEVAVVCNNFSKSIKHRGPDDEGFVLFTINGNAEMYKGDNSMPGIDLPHISTAHGEYKAAMVHRRLAIISPGVKGHQPMHTVDDRYWIVYNGESFNFKELDLKNGFINRSSNDAETALNLIVAQEQNGFTELDGFHAFAVYDSQNLQLKLYRDPTGVKPLFYTQTEEFFAFCSEAKPLRQMAGLHKINATAVFHFLTEGIVIPGEAFVHGINEVKHQLHFDPKSLQIENIRFDFKPVKPRENLKEQIMASVKSRLMSDVPLGFAVSGGLDSAIILGAARKILGPDAELKAFSIVSESEEDESVWQKKVVDFNHAEWHQTNIEFSGPGLLAEVIAAADMPAVAWNNLAHYQLAKMVSDHKVKVFFNGQGADELFGGYPDYLQRAWATMPIYLLKNKNNLPLNYSEIVIGWFKFFAKRNVNKGKLKNEFLKGKISWLNPIFLDSEPYLWQLSHLSAEQKMQHDYFEQKLQQMLRWEDANGMAHSIESRNPFADDLHLADYLSVNMRTKMTGGFTKGLLRNAVSDFVPSDVLWRTDKMGFTVPNDKLTWRNRNAWKDAFLSTGLVDWSPQYQREIKFKSLQMNNNTDLQWFFRLSSLSYFIEHLKSE